MKSLFAQSGLVFPKFWVFEAIFEACGQNFPIFKNSVCTFYCTLNDRLDLTVSMQKPVWKTEHPGPRYLKNKTKCGCGLDGVPCLKNIFANILAQGSPFFNPIFALKPRDRDGRFEYNKRFKRSFEISKNFPHEPQKAKIWNYMKTRSDWTKRLFI